MKKRALCPLSGVHLTIKPKFHARNTREIKKTSKQYHKSDKRAKFEAN